MERTVIRNFPGSDTEEAIINWRRRMGSVQLLCPLCWEWFKLPKGTRIEKATGNVLDVIYHICDTDSDEEEGWVVLPQLEGWEVKKQ